MNTFAMNISIHNRAMLHSLPSDKCVGEYLTGMLDQVCVHTLFWNIMESVDCTCRDGVDTQTCSSVFMTNKTPSGPKKRRESIELESDGMAKMFFFFRWASSILPESLTMVLTWKMLPVNAHTVLYIQLSTYASHKTMFSLLNPFLSVDMMSLTFPHHSHFSNV